MSDIGIDVPWWILAVFFLAYAFVPIAVATTLALVRYFFARTRLSLAILILLAIPCTVGALALGAGWFSDRSDARNAEANEKAHTRTLARDARVRGVVLPAGTVYRDPDGDSEALSATLSRPAVMFGIPVRGAVRYYFPGGLDGDVTLAKGALVDGVPCAAGNASFERGMLASCTLPHPASVEGIPCSGDVTIVAGSNVRCTLARTFRYRGVRLFQGLTFSFSSVDFGTTIPETRVFGKRLSPGASVTFESDGRLAFSLEKPFALAYRGCTLTSFVTSQRTSTGYGFRAPDNTECRVGLPAGAIVR